MKDISKLLKKNLKYIHNQQAENIDAELSESI